METKEIILNAKSEETQSESKFFSEFAPIEVSVETKKPNVCIEPFLDHCGLSSILY